MAGFIGKKPRAVIHTDKSRDSWMVESLSNPDMAVIHTIIDGQETLAVSSYLDINNDLVITPELEELVAFAARKGWGLIIGMDSNCHSVIYGLETNNRGEKLEDFLADTGLLVENFGREPTYESRGISTRIDITLTKNLKFDILSWKVYRRYNASDDNTIMFKVGREKVLLSKTRKWHKADWGKFADSLLAINQLCQKELKMRTGRKN